MAARLKRAQHAQVALDAPAPIGVYEQTSVADHTMCERRGPTDPFTLAAVVVLVVAAAALAAILPAARAARIDPMRALREE